MPYGLRAATLNRSPNEARTDSTPDDGCRVESGMGTDADAAGVRVGLDIAGDEERSKLSTKAVCLGPSHSLMKSLRHAKPALAAPISHVARVARRSFTSVSAARPLAPSSARSATRVHSRPLRPWPVTLLSRQIITSNVFADIFALIPRRTHNVHSD